MLPLSTAPLEWAGPAGCGTAGPTGSSPEHSDMALYQNTQFIPRLLFIQGFFLPFCYDCQYVFC